MKVFNIEEGIPCETNCPYLVVTDTLNCQKEFEGLVDMEEVRVGTSGCPFWPHKDPETKEKGKILDPLGQILKDES